MTKYEFRYPYKLGDLIQHNHFGYDDIGLVLKVNFSSKLHYEKEFYCYTVLVLSQNKVCNWIDMETSCNYFLVSEIE